MALFKKEPQEEWVRVKGYKGMHKDMKAHYDFQYELGKTYTVEDPDSISICEYGYHFFFYFKDVFRYYDLKNNNRFFKVEALVRKKDYDEYGKTYTTTIFSDRVDKLVAKEITILEEVSTEEMFEEIKILHHDTIMIDKLKIEDMNKPGQITGLYSAGLCKGTYYRVYFPRTGEIEYVNIRNVRYDREKVLYCYDDKNVIKKK